MTFLRAVYAYMVQLGIYNTDKIDRIFWRMFILFILLMLVTAAKADGLYLELGIGGDKERHLGRNPSSVIRLRYEKEHEYWWLPRVLEYDHHSSIPDGKPFNGNEETTTDQFSIIWRFKFL